MLSTTKINDNYNWIRVADMTLDEKELLINKYHVTSELLGYATDPDERARVETDPDKHITLLIFDVISAGIDNVQGQTSPVGIMLTTHNLITFTTQKTAFVNQIIDENIPLKQIATNGIQPLDIILPVLYRLTTQYFNSITKINRRREEIQRDLDQHKNWSEITSLMNLETSLVYIQTSIKTNVSLIKDLQRSKQIVFTNEQSEKLADVLVEAEQGLEMADMAAQVIDRVSNAYSNVLDSNLNNTMKFLTVFSIVLAAPNIVFGFFGQNVTTLPFMKSNYGWELTILITVVLSLVIIWILKRNDFLNK